MWNKTEDRKSSPGSSSSAVPPAQHPGAAVSPDSPGAAATVSQGLKIKGEISGRGDFFLDGAFEGRIDIPEGTLTVGPHGRVNAEIEAREIVIRGEVIGTLKAHERIQIGSTGKVTGNMDTRGIVIEDGAILHSEVATPQTVAQAAAPEKDPAHQPPGPETPTRSRGAAAGAAGQPSPQEP